MAEKLFVNDDTGRLDGPFDAAPAIPLPTTATPVPAATSAPAAAPVVRSFPIRDANIAPPPSI